jgi:hypothetical protein
MTSCPSRETLALFTGQDLAADELLRIAAHVQECPSCESLCDALLSDRALLQAAPEVSADDLFEIRRHVLSEIGGAARRRRYAWIGAMAAALALFAILPSFNRPKTVLDPVSRVVPNTTSKPPVEIAPSPVRRPAVVKRVAVKHRRREAFSGQQLIAALDRLAELDAPPATPTDAPIVITLQTADPNVTIILVPDNTGEVE